MDKLSRRALLGAAAVAAVATAAMDEKMPGPRPFLFKADALGGLLVLHPWSFGFSKPQSQRIFVKDGDPPIPAPKPPEQRLIVTFEDDTFLRTQYRDRIQVRVVSQGILALAAVDGLETLRDGAMLNDMSCARNVELFASVVAQLAIATQTRDSNRVLNHICERYVHGKRPHRVATFGADVTPDSLAVVFGYALAEHLKQPRTR